jgi:hypothetical protein
MRVAIGTPIHRHPETGFAISLARLCIMTAKATVDGEKGAIDLDVIPVVSTNLPEARTSIWRRAVENEADYLLWADADHVFPPHALGQLLVHRLPVVGANYVKRRQGAGLGTATALDGSQLDSTVEKAKGAPEEVSALGLGFCLMDVKAVHGALGGGDYYPLFEMRAAPDGVSFTPEDALFFHRMRSAGIKFYVDHALSMEMGHLGEAEFKFPS